MQNAYLSAYHNVQGRQFPNRNLQADRLVYQKGTSMDSQIEKQIRIWPVEEVATPGTVDLDYTISQIDSSVAAHTITVPAPTSPGATFGMVKYLTNITGGNTVTVSSATNDFTPFTLEPDQTVQLIYNQDERWLPVSGVGAGAVVPQTLVFEADVGGASDARNLIRYNTLNPLVLDYQPDIVFGAAQTEFDAANGPLMFFDKARGAFRVGEVSGADWNQAQRGIYSFACGEDTSASGAHSLAAGTGSDATGAFSVAIGSDQLASAQGSSAVGGANHRSTGLNTGCFGGAGSSASGDNSGVFCGSGGSVVNGPRSVVIGGNDIEITDRSDMVALGGNSGRQTTYEVDHNEIGPVLVADGAAATDIFQYTCVNAYSFGLDIHMYGASSVACHYARRFFAIRASGGALTVAASATEINTGVALVTSHVTAGLVFTLRVEGVAGQAVNWRGSVVVNRIPN